MHSSAHPAGTYSSPYGEIRAGQGVAERQHPTPRALPLGELTPRAMPKPVRIARLLLCVLVGCQALTLAPVLALFVLLGRGRILAGSVPFAALVGLCSAAVVALAVVLGQFRSGKPAMRIAAIALAALLGLAASYSTTVSFLAGVLPAGVAVAGIVLLSTPVSVAWFRRFEHCGPERQFAEAPSGRAAEANPTAYLNPRAR